ncbi:hypothetical protein B9Z55_007431 [Caenorhabditis nigoni]|uniref:DUF281 domain-containing protein n=1 Tax=Caenorhabditis nigoni TaxID=1611254 RepID=A0A2G5V9T0_9PELO|nr:hypothetical protein B9Z55_007431 [Caenorhabditis nigoni]
MKSLLILLLLVPTIFCRSNTFSRGSCLQHINAARSVFADKLQLANMNALVYNKKLEKKALEQLAYSGPCPQPSIISHNQTDIYLNVKGHDLIVELLSGTGSTQLACVRSKCGDEDILSIVTDVQESSPISGPPGTQCPPERLANSQGLCAPEYSRGGYARKFSVGGFFDSVEKTFKNTVGAIEKTAKAMVKGAKEVVEEVGGVAEKAGGGAVKIVVDDAAPKAIEIAKDPENQKKAWNAIQVAVPIIISLYG